MHLLTYILTFWHPTSVSHTIHYGAGLGDRLITLRGTHSVRDVARRDAARHVPLLSELRTTRLFSALLRAIPRHAASVRKTTMFSISAYNCGVARCRARDVARSVSIRTAERIASPWRAQCEFIATSLHCLDNSSTYNIYSFSPFLFVIIHHLGVFLLFGVLPLAACIASHVRLRDI